MRDRARSLRREPTRAERRLWGLLRNRNLDGMRFRRQQPIGPYVVDFFCAEHTLVVETDGISHDGRREQDDRRTAFLELAGYRVLRFLDEDVIQRTNDVMEAILRGAGR